MKPVYVAFPTEGNKKLLIDCNDIKTVNFMGYSVKEGTFNEADEEKPVYRVNFKDGTYIEVIDPYGAYKKYTDFLAGAFSEETTEKK